MDDDIHEHLRESRYEDAFNLLLERYREKVFRLAYSILMSEAAAEDVAQDVFVKVWRAFPSYNGRASVSTWLYAIARNTSLTALKRRRSTVSLSDPETVHALEGLPELHTTEPEGGAGMDVGELLATLPEKYRKVIALFYLEQKSYEEVSALLGMPMGTVKTFLHRARKELARRCEATSPAESLVEEVAL